MLARIFLICALLLLAGCTGDSDDHDSTGADLRIEIVDGPTYVISDPPKVTCDKTSRDGLDRMNVSIPLGEADSITGYFRLTFVTELAEEPNTWELPYSSGDEANEMFMFVDGTGSASSAKGSQGTVTITRAACGEHPELRATFDATLGSQETEQAGVTIKGEIDRVKLGPSNGGTIILN